MVAETCALEIQVHRTCNGSCHLRCDLSDRWRIATDGPRRTVIKTSPRSHGVEHFVLGDFRLRGWELDGISKVLFGHLMPCVGEFFIEERSNLGVVLSAQTWAAHALTVNVPVGK